MGVVYKAIDPQIGRMVAIKVLLADFEDDSTLQRFHSEAQSTGQMQHPNIVTLYELGERDGAPYLVMEFLEGESLDKIIASDRQLLLTETLSIVNQVCAGLHYAHTRKIIHRDIKPGNVVRLPEGSIKLVDFGIAKFGNDRHTRAGMVIGRVSTCLRSRSGSRGRRTFRRLRHWGTSLRTDHQARTLRGRRHRLDDTQGSHQPHSDIIGIHSGRSAPSGSDSAHRSG
jgi:serine/threonine protein kinase